MDIDQPGTTLLDPPVVVSDVPPPPEPPVVVTHRPRRRRPWLRIGAVAVVVAGGAGLGGGYVGGRLAGGHTTTVTASAKAVTNAKTAPTQTVAQVAAAVSPSVVEITVRSAGSTSEGSGIVLRSDGVIVTNAHVVADAANGGTLTVKLADGTTADATVLGTDPTHDIAVVKANGVSGLTVAPIGTASSLHVGDTVVAVGSPLGLEGTVTSGIVSALDRTVEIGGGQGGSPFERSSTTTLTGAIQTDASVNPGNSGGALVDAAGNVVGITTAMASINGESGSIGIGFAIPIDRAVSIAQKLLAAS